VFHPHSGAGLGSQELADVERPIRQLLARACSPASEAVIMGPVGKNLVRQATDEVIFILVLPMFKNHHTFTHFPLVLCSINIIDFYQYFILTEFTAILYEIGNTYLYPCKSATDAGEPERPSNRPIEKGDTL
jgi:hypothetical protein